ncbi:MAG: hypothetical protein H6767_09680 [Candidatus Peribacteria bacterium]|nr:MAG: hypothetical protein H6767_09680 [Candidatus Peribacteria bacterium]
MPDHIIHKYHFISQSEALCKIHFPHNSHDIDEAKRRLAYEELYQINYQAISKKYQSFADSEGKSLAIPMNPERVKMILEKFPFELTDHQKITLFQVLKDMEKTHAMQRLLEGDVGTGKTAVAFIAAIHGILETREETPSPWPSPLEERQQSFSIRKLELTSP